MDDCKYECAKAKDLANSISFERVLSLLAALAAVKLIVS
jgi:hypothetical protein